MLYLTTGIMDKYDNTNIELETAIFSVSLSVVSINHLLQLTSIKKSTYIFYRYIQKKSYRL